MTGICWKYDLMCWTVLAGLLGVANVDAAGPVEYPGPLPGEAKAYTQDGHILLYNDALECKWLLADGCLRPIFISHKDSLAVSLKESECFQLLLGDGRVLKASGLKVVREPAIEELASVSEASRLGARSAGVQVRLLLATPDESLAIQWCVELRDDSSYVRQYISLAPIAL